MQLLLRLWKLYSVSTEDHAYQYALINYLPKPLIWEHLRECFLQQGKMQERGCVNQYIRAVSGKNRQCIFPDKQQLRWPTALLKDSAKDTRARTVYFLLSISGWIFSGLGWGARDRESCDAGIKGYRDFHGTVGANLADLQPLCLHSSLCLWDYHVEPQNFILFHTCKPSVVQKIIPMPLFSGYKDVQAFAGSINK